ncbi:glycosyltransferase family 4 protein [Herbaspirillum sp. YR522]|uniref:glycosyltransferase family 4 protein n=1 Tax=Herbaspirillum sp. YR522 TaxID=1144342 RepID=UPI00026F9142|nr:glycosyltransferase family 4 protein [Herbaspirillum sp. YR522]EJN00857.1 glycosyltransferase [Herbaspirillum sp. YR522]
MKRKILYVITADWFFCSHFMARAMAARDAGYEVVVAARAGEHVDEIVRAGLGFIDLKVSRRGVNPFSELATVLALWKIYRHQRPHIVHHIALKPILYGTLAALLGPRPHVINAPVGMGFVFTSPRLLARCLKPLIMLGMRRLLNPRGSRVVFENADDLGAAVQQGLVRRSDTVLIRGAGVDTDEVETLAEPVGPVRVILAARMLWDKGIEEFVGAARLVREKLPDTRFLLVGSPDEGNPASIPPAVLQKWQREGVVQWLGHRTDVPELLAQAHIACLPSYREGLPKFLLEALAAGRAVVATDVPGCREAVEPGVNGLLVPARDTAALAAALCELVPDAQRRQAFGRAGRERAEKQFSSARVIAETLAAYRQFDA